jgi:type IV pilus assembly protein PilA
MDMDRPGRQVTSEYGFTLIELMIVILVIGVMIAIALPTYIGARNRAADRAMQSDMRTGLAAALAYYSEAGDWDGFDAGQAGLEEPRLGWVGGGTPGRGQISVQIHSGQNLLLVGLSASDTFFCLSHIPTTPATDTGRGPAFAEVDTIAECTGGW